MNLYQKRAVDNKMYYFSLSLLFLALLCFTLYFAVFFFQETRVQNAYQYEVNILQGSSAVTLLLRLMWIQLNIFPMNASAFDALRTQIYEKQRQIEKLSIHSANHELLSNKMKEFSLQFTFGNICQALELDCIQKH